MTPTISFPKPMVAIVGDSGTGKSTSLRNMPWAETLLIDTELKGLPFDYTPIINYVQASTTGAVIANITKAKQNPALKYIVLDSFNRYLTYAYTEAVASSNGDGFAVWKSYADSVRMLTNVMRNDKKICIMTCVPEHLIVQGDTNAQVTTRRIYVQGKTWEGKVELEFLVVLYTKVAVGKDGVVSYNFLTNTDGICSAKSPMGMFKDKLVPNDLAVCLKSIDK